MSKIVLVPVDGSQHSKKALELATELCNGFEGELSLLHVVQSLPQDRTLALGGAAITVHDTGAALERIGGQLMDAARQLAAEHGCPVAGTKLVAGDPAMQIVARAKEIEADMIVMGSRGLSDLTGLLVGSVSHKVIHLAPCTCVSVR